MRRQLLDPPQPVLPFRRLASGAGERSPETELLDGNAFPTAEDPAGARDGHTASSSSPHREPLGRPARARYRRRSLFDPDAGWFRNLERETSLYLSRRVFPRMPILQKFYDSQVRRSLALSEATIPLAGLPDEFDGFRILLITDVHAGPFLGVEALTGAFRRLSTVEPDVVLLGGDLTTSRRCEFLSHRAAWQTLAAPHGVFAVMGNHDHYTGEVPALIDEVESLGIRVLHNASTELERDGAGLSLAGVDDLLRGTPDLDAALAGTRPPVVLISHNPDLFFEAARRDVALTLSGHTHAGQVRVPGLPVLVRQSRYRLDEGRYRSGQSELVVSRGLGAVGIPCRWHCSPEAVLLTLRRTDG